MRKLAIFLLTLSTAFIFAGCSDKEALKDIQASQQEILETEKEIQTTQHEILESHKKIIAKIEAVEKKVQSVKAAPTRPKIDYNKVHNLPVGKSVVKGNPAAPVTIVEFSDFQCPYCSRLQPTLKDVLKAYPNDVKLVYKHYPLSFHKQAKNAAKAAEAAREQGKFWEMHDIIYENFNKLSENSFTEFAQKFGLDMEKFKADYASSKYDLLIQADMNLARKVGVTGTPSLFMNGKRMQRRSLDDFKAGIDSYLKKK